MNTKKRPAEVRDAVLAEYAKGERIRDIGARHGITDACVGKWARQAGLPYRRVPKGRAS